MDLSLDLSITETDARSPACQGTRVARLLSENYGEQIYTVSYRRKRTRSWQVDVSKYFALIAFGPSRDMELDYNDVLFSNFIAQFVWL